MNDYAACYRDHRLDTPERFNFGRDVVDRWARERDGTALIAVDAEGNEQRYRFSDIKRESDRLASWLRKAGVSRGDRMIVMLPRIAHWQVALVACMKIGAVPIPCITMLTGKDLAYRVQHSGAIGAISVRDECDKFATIPALRVRLCVDGQRPGWTDLATLEPAPADFEPCDLGAEEPAILYYTSGSTGNPKGVCHASRAIHAWRVSAWYWLDLGPEDVMWCTADTGWSKAGTSILFGPWSQGSCVLFYEGPFDARQRLALLERYRVSVFCAAATELRRLVALDAGDFDLSALRLSVSAGESVNPEVLEAWTRMTGVPLLDGYGQTETLMTVLNYPCMPVRAGAMGKPLPGVVIGLHAEDGHIVDGPGQGQLAIRAPNAQLMLGYWNDPDRTAAAYVTDRGARWFLTGDNVRIDADGYLHFIGRSDDIINSSGYRIGPQEVENALIEHPAVRESAVVGVPDAARGELVKAFVVLAEGYTADAALIQALQDHVKSVTAPYKYPRLVEFVDDLPKTVSGKIQRNLLRARSRG
ncbi:MAG: AMP-binding protein [Gammaproteobacteria bacterium]|nr:AMP-binding protein [Gammaproteobacteria bacterium]